MTGGIMRLSFLIALLITVSIAGAALALPVVVRWGGPGYDPAVRKMSASSLFSAHPDLYAPDGPAHFEIWVDSEKTVNGVWRMVIRQEGQKDIDSGRCYKSQKHITAPYACRFRKTDFLDHKGTGEVVVFDQDGQELLTSPVDIIQLKQVF
jgi:hypothetical protein